MAHWPKLRIGFTGAITFRDRDKGRPVERLKLMEDGILSFRFRAEIILTSLTEGKHIYSTHFIERTT